MKKIDVATSHKSQVTAIIGGGNMGEALIKGLNGHGLFVCEANPARARYLKNKYKVNIAQLSDAVSKAELIVFAVKPQDMAEALKQVKQLGDKLYISIAAGLTTKFFENHLGGKPKVVRAMPNMPALIGEGITGICAGRFAKPVDLKLAQTVLAAVGETVIVKEAMMDAVTAVSGSGPAYVFLFVEQWMAAAKKLGFKEEESKRFIYQTLIGSAHLLVKSAFDPGTLRAKVTSKGGTTQAAMDVFQNGKFDQIFQKALLAAKNRSKELAK